MRSKKVVVVGAGGHSKVVIDILNNNDYEVFGVIDGNEALHGGEISGVPILGGNDELIKVLDSGVTKAFVAIGNNTIRVKIGKELKLRGFTLVNAIHPQTIIAKSVEIGEGTMVAAGGIINSESKIGDYVIINTGATIDHDCVISSGVHISPGANLAGNVKIEKNTHIGIGSCVIQGIRIGENTIIGAGSVVVRNIESNVTAYGVPTKVQKK